MKKLVAHVGLLAAVATPVAFAEPYDLELIGSYGQSELDPAETDIYNLTAIAHFKSVETQEHPLEEAAFLERSNYVMLDYTRNETDPGAGADDANDNVFGLALHLNTGSRYFIDFGMEKSNEEDSNQFLSTVGFGAYVQDNITVDITVTDETIEPKDEDKYSGMGYALNGRGVFKLGGEQAVAVDGGFQVVDFDDGNDNEEIATLGGRYYFMRTTHVGLSYSTTSRDDEDNDTFTVEAQHFITPSFALGTSFGQESSDEDDAEDRDFYNLWAKLRI